MKVIRAQLGLWLLGSAFMVAQTLAPANVQKLQIVNAGVDVRIELTLSTSIKPSVVIATNPDRLVLELPNTSSDGKQKHLAVHSRGIRGVRIGLHQADPPVTHLVVDLDASAPYRLLTEGNRITLVISPVSVSASNHRPPARAVSGGLVSIFRSGAKSGASSSRSADSVDPSGASSANSPPSVTTPNSTQTGTSDPNGSSTTVDGATAPQPEQIRTAAPGSSFPAASTSTTQPTTAAEAEAGDSQAAPAVEENQESPSLKSPPKRLHCKLLLLPAPTKPC